MNGTNSSPENFSLSLVASKTVFLFIFGSGSSVESGNALKLPKVISLILEYLKVPGVCPMP